MADVVDRIAPAAAPPQPVEHQSPNTAARARLNVLRRAINGDPAEEDDITQALNGLLQHFMLPGLPDPSEDDNVVRCDKAELEEALARARCGQIRDCVIHLGRALPSQFMGIADAIEREQGTFLL